MNILKFSLLCLLAVSLTACFDGDDGKDGINGTNGMDGMNGTNGVDGTNGSDGADGNANSATALGSVAADGDPIQITDPSALKQDFADLFGDADDDPLDVEMGDTIQMIVDRDVRVES